MQDSTSILQGGVQSQYPHHLPLYLIITSIVLFLSYKFMYNLYFSPLSEYPGPKSWATSRLPLLLAGIAGRQEAQIAALHKKYGPVVRIAPDEISYTSAEAWKTIYSHRAKEMPKPRDGRGIPLPVNGVDGIISAHREAHTRLRRSIAHAFSEKALREQEPLLQSYVSQLMDGIRQYGTQAPINMSRWYNWTTFDIIGDLAFGYSFQGLNKAESHPMVSMMIENSKSIPFQHFARYYGIFDWLKYITPAKYIKARAETTKIGFKRLEERLNTETDRKDFFHYILRNEGEEEKQLSMGEKQSLAMALLIAGSETTATLLTGLTYYLLKNPKAYNKLASEIRDSFVDDTEIDMLKVDRLPYMHACIQEALRMYPPVAGDLPRIVPQPGENIEGKWVPAGTVVGVHQTATYRREDNFCQPNDYIPERWLGVDAPAQFANDNQAALQPFSLGPRNCIGRNLAWAEVRLIIAHMLFNFDLELVGDHADWEDQGIYLLRDRKPLMVQFHATST